MLSSFETQGTRTAVLASFNLAAMTALPADVPLPRPRPADAPAPATLPRQRVNLPQPSTNLEQRMLVKVAAKGAFNDGTFVGPATDAYYGIIQIGAVIQGGRLVDIRVVQYPSDRRTSVRINRIALPMLRDEAVSAQSGDVDIISGATLTSRAFIRSLGGALRQARS